MHDEKIGKHCQICSRKDYIPYNCKKCQLILCDEHYWAHPCVSDQYQKKDHPDLQGPVNQTVYRCTLDSCNKKLYTVNHYYCEKCDKLFCLAHRMPEEHACKSIKQDNCQLI